MATSKQDAKYRQSVKMERIYKNIEYMYDLPRYPRASQLEKALELARQKKMMQGCIKKYILNGAVSIEDVLDWHVPEWLSTVRIGTLLKSKKYIGTMKSQIICDKANVHKRTKLGHMSTRQKIAVIMEIQRIK